MGRRRLKTLLVNFSDQYCVGLGYLVAALRGSGRQVDVIDTIGPNWVRRLLRHVRSKGIGVVGFQVQSSNFALLDRVARRVKRARPGVVTVAGGPHPTLVPHDLARSSFDAFVRGEGERPLVELIARLETGRSLVAADGGVPDNLVVKTRHGLRLGAMAPFVADLDRLPHPDRDTRAHARTWPNRRILTFVLSRGCPYDCAYCSNHALARTQPGRYYRVRSPARAVDEIRQAILRQPHPRLLLLDDDVLGLDRQWSREFLKLYGKHVGVPFACNLRPDVVNGRHDVLDLMKDSGCVEVRFGVESGDEGLRRKVLNRNLSNASIREFALAARKRGFSLWTFNMVGLPDETPEAFRATIDLNLAMAIDIPTLTVFYPYPGTRLYEYCVEKGYVDPDFYLESDGERDSSVLKLPAFSRQQIDDAVRGWGVLFRNKPRNRFGLVAIYRDRRCMLPPGARFGRSRGGREFLAVPERRRRWAIDDPQVGALLRLFERPVTLNAAMAAASSTADHRKRLASLLERLMAQGLVVPLHQPGCYAPGQRLSQQ
jgi:anaerobic magnesium-protoporphyrin IX monomethyl ester cyclase